MGAPQQKDLGARLVQYMRQDRVGNGFPSAFGMRCGFVRFDRERGIEQQSALARPAQQAVALARERVLVFAGEFGEHIAQAGGVRQASGTENARPWAWLGPWDGSGPRITPCTS